MQVTKKNLADTKVALTIVADASLLNKTKDQVLKRLAKNVKVAGFRSGKAPLSLVEKNLDQARLQTEFLDAAINRLYIDAASEQKIRPVEQPQVKITKFVPFDTLEIVAEVNIIGPITLPDYKHLKTTKTEVRVSAKDIDQTIRQLQYREAAKKETDQAAGQSDEVVIDFEGKDSKSGEPINGAKGIDYPLHLGSGTFIPGFEDHIVGLKPGDKKVFELTFPKNYGLKVLQNRKVSFKVTVKNVHKVTMPLVDNKFAAKVGAFKTVAELRADVEKQLIAENQRQADRKYENDLIQELADGTTVALPSQLVEGQLKDLEDEERQNLAYRGLTWTEYLKSEGLSEEQYHEKMHPEAELRVKIGLALAEIAEKEAVNVTAEELNDQLNQLKKQYPEGQMQEELDKPASRQNIFNRLVTEKTLSLIVSYNQK